MGPKPMPSSNEIAKKNMVVIGRFQLIIHPQALNPKKQKHTKYMPAWMTWVIFPLSTNFPENKRDTAIPIAMRVKKKPVDEVIPICLAYIAT